jgi:hypothetical protein
MGSVAEIEIAIQRLPIAEQRIIARHLDAALRAKREVKGHPAANEGIPVLPDDPCLTATAEPSRPKFSKKHGRPHATELM